MILASHVQRCTLMQEGIRRDELQNPLEESQNNLETKSLGISAIPPVNFTLHLPQVGQLIAPRGNLVEIDCICLVKEQGGVG